MNQSSETKEMDRFLELDVMGENFTILKTVGASIPFIGSIIDTKPEIPVVIDAVSPEFLMILIDSLKNGHSIENIKSKIKGFDKKNVEIWLKYLGMDNLHKQIYGCKYIDKKLVIIDALMIYDSASPKKFSYIFYV